MIHKPSIPFVQRLRLRGRTRSDTTPNSLSPPGGERIPRTNSRIEPLNLSQAAGLSSHSLRPPTVPSPLPSDGRGEGQGEVRAPFHSMFDVRCFRVPGEGWGEGAILASQVHGEGRGEERFSFILSILLILSSTPAVRCSMFPGLWRGCLKGGRWIWANSRRKNMGTLSKNHLYMRGRRPVSRHAPSGLARKESLRRRRNWQSRKAA